MVVRGAGDAVVSCHVVVGRVAGIATPAARGWYRGRMSPTGYREPGLARRAR